MNNWIEAIRLPDGHKIFRAEDGKWAVADDSGHYPENTDDGVLWLHNQRPIQVVRNNYGASRYTLLVPVYDNDGEESAFVTDVRSMLTLADKFRWEIETKDAHYNVQSFYKEDQHDSD